MFKFDELRFCDQFFGKEEKFTHWISIALGLLGLGNLLETRVSFNMNVGW